MPIVGHFFFTVFCTTLWVVLTQFFDTTLKYHNWEQMLWKNHSPPRWGGSKRGPKYQHLETAFKCWPVKILYFQHIHIIVKVMRWPYLPSAWRNSIRHQSYEPSKNRLKMPTLDRSRFGSPFFQDILTNIWYTILCYKKEKKIQGCQLKYTYVSLYFT